MRLLGLTLVTSLLSVAARADSTSDALARATAAIQAAAPRAQSDPAFPSFHVTSPAQWINDPNGPIYHKGWYHLFYQLHPFSDQSGPKYWGHVRSRDLVRWEPLPIALAPDADHGESEVWSGCCTINGLGVPMIFYTSIAPGKSAGTHAEQWAALGDKDLLTWHRSPANPVLTEALNGDKKIYDWRDPFIFHDKKRTFMVLGGNLNQAKGGQAVVNIYEAQNPALTNWQYRGVLFQLPGDARTAECPNFFQLGDHWVLFVSPYGHVQYYVGDFNPETCRFQSITRGTLDTGSFYAPNTMQLEDGRRLVWGWINGFPGGHGWNGCLSLPRQLSLTTDCHLRQAPAPQLTKLRGKKTEWRNLMPNANPQVLILPKANTLEIQLDFDWQAATNIVVELQSGTPDTRPVSLNYRSMDFHAFPEPSQALNLRLFLDRSVLETFLNETHCATKVISPLDDNATLRIRTEGGAAHLKRVQAWPMKTIW